MNGYTMYATYTTNIANVNSYISLYNNLWKQALLTEQLSLVEHMQRDFINMAAHELRTPTQAILGYSEMAMLDDDYKDFDIKNGRYISTIHRNANRLYSLLEDILNVVRIENHSLVLNKQPVNIFDIIMDVIDDFQNLINMENYSNKNLQISLDPLSKELKSDDIIVNVDKTRIYQVLSNLLNNAIKFSGVDGGIIVSVDVENDQSYSDTRNDNNKKDIPMIEPEGKRNMNSISSNVIVKIKDRGKGIPSTMASSLFTKFATDSSSGTGLGLYISKNIINAHGGNIWANNNTDGGGATFSFSLPCMRNN
jgi:two-component system sensor histidine kinase VicK